MIQMQNSPCIKAYLTTWHGHVGPRGTTRYPTAPLHDAQVRLVTPGTRSHDVACTAEASKPHLEGG